MTSTFGTITSGDGVFTLEFERILDTTVADAWSAVTEPERLARWMAPYVGELRLGGTWQALLDDGSVFTEGTVTECAPPHRYVTTWQATDEEPTVVTVTVEAHPHGALLRLRHEALRSVFYGAGWQAYLEQLDDELGSAQSSATDPGREPGVDWTARYTALSGPWQARFDALDR